MNCDESRTLKQLKWKFIDEKMIELGRAQLFKEFKKYYKELEKDDCEPILPYTFGEWFEQVGFICPDYMSSEDFKMYFRSDLLMVFDSYLKNKLKEEYKEAAVRELSENEDLN